MVLVWGILFVVEMKIYLVGGAVRDKLLGVVPNDNDYVVVGSSIEDMLLNGFRPIGRSFPVFIKKKGSKDEYALARKEIKLGPKHTDFGFIFDEEITLEEDLVRRDFTCNAMAYDLEEDRIIDYHGGIEDIQRKILRHVSPHFVEDPLRVIRLCRFAAQLGFSVAEETMNLARDMVLQNQLDHLSTERIWAEIKKALRYPNFYRFLEVAHECFALKRILSAVEQLWFVKKDSQGKTLAEHVIECLKHVSKDSEIVKFATLLHSIGETSFLGISHPQEESEKQGVKIIKDICRTLKIPNDYQSFAVFVCRNYKKLGQVGRMNLEQLLDLTDDYMKRTPADFENFMAICRATVPDSDFGSSERKIRNIYGILSHVRANQMPNFNTLKKDASFKEEYRKFKLNILREHGL